MFSISKINLIALASVIVVLSGFSLYFFWQSDIKADSIPCNSSCAYIKVTLNGLRPDVALPTNHIASIKIIDPNGVTLSPGSSGSNGSKTFLYPREVGNSAFIPGVVSIGPFHPGNGYKVVIDDLNSKTGSWYMLADPLATTKTVNLTADQTSDVNFDLTLATGGTIYTVVTIAGDTSIPTSGKFADQLLTCGSQVETGVINFRSEGSSSLIGTEFKPRDTSTECILEVKNFDTTRYKFIGSKNPIRLIIGNRDVDWFYSFEAIPQPAVTSQPTPTPSPVKSPAAIESSNQKSATKSPVAPTSATKPTISPTPVVIISPTQTVSTSSIPLIARVISPSPIANSLLNGQQSKFNVIAIVAGILVIISLVFAILKFKANKTQ